MTWENQTLARFVEAQRSASEFILNETNLGFTLTTAQAFTMQAIAHILSDNYGFTVPKIAELTKDTVANPYTIVNKFVAVQFVASEYRLESPKRGPSPRLFIATELGGRVMDYFI